MEHPTKATSVGIVSLDLTSCSLHDLFANWQDHGQAAPALDFANGRGIVRWPRCGYFPFQCTIEIVGAQCSRAVFGMEHQLFWRVVVVHRVDHAIAQCSSSICPCTWLATGFPKKFALQTQTINSASHVLKDEGVAIRKQWQKVPDWSIRLVGPQNLPITRIEGFHHVVCGPHRRRIAPTSCCENNSLMHHGKTIVFSDGHRQIGMP
mmetsp:Transcript_15756/g.34756  ORF Transcript_15756/g.34756 Transcript_15756/m.34756 type:complete len:207 (+) Transcript_15756:460-1080(+)